MTRLGTPGRRVIAGLAGALVLRRLALAQAPGGQGLLARLQAAKKVRVGVANQPPFSALNPDGTLSGVAPTVSQMVLKRLGITEIEGYIGTYGELVPGMLAGRWDFISACLTVNQPRCEQVQYSDPITSDGRAIVTRKGEKGPKRIPGLKDYVDGLLAKRFQAQFGSHPGIADMIKKRGLENELDVIYPVEDDAISFAACAFRKDDTDLHAAFQRELRALKASGEFGTVVAAHGFDVNDKLLNATPEQACTF